MIDVKLIVRFIFYTSTFICQCFSSLQYCEICPDHTLCKYTVPGPSGFCKDYDHSSLLTNDEANDITQKINERRNFIALGISKDFPSAANMNKIHWSDKLAEIAQRWVDQCDTSVRPHRHDTCRDLENGKVGQNIATVFGPSPGLNVKNLIEMWFMQILDYSGNVTYYDQSSNEMSNDFTQLIWAETNTVGCGKAKFYDASSTLIERLICNFAPKGNIHGKPVYTIGYAATQCHNNRIPDSKEHLGLCVDPPKMLSPVLSSSSPPVTSLLRILNLANNSENLDPITNIKQIKTPDLGYRRDGIQKVRQVTLNRGQESSQHDRSTQFPIFWINTNNNISRRHNHEQKGHSRIHHGHYHGSENNHEHQEFTKSYFNTLPFKYQPSQEFRHHQQIEKCTRKLTEQCTENTSNCVSDRCTRGEKNEFCHSRQYSKSNECGISTQHQCPPEPESCLCDGEKNNLCTSPSQCTRHTKCECCSNKWSTMPCFTSGSKKIDSRKSAAVHYYDLLPKLPLRSGYEKSKSSESSNIFYKTNKPRRYNDDIKQVKENDRFLKTIENDDNMDYLHYSFDSSKRKKKALENDITYKPFWKIDEPVKQNTAIQLKAIKYTTMAKRKNRKSTRRQTTKMPFSTETITISLTDNITTKKVLTERYLSFEELMHLRKFSVPEEEYNARRKNDATTTTTKHVEKTTEYTANTPFLRKKYCTRKLTCTWTSPTVTDSDGHIITNPGGGGGKGSGSRTPPGYVEGCTRTATCSRIYLDRNKMPSEEVNATETTLEDEDYCEKRSLNRRNLKDEIPLDINFTEEKKNTDYSLPEEITKSPFHKMITENICQCSFEQMRFKRHNKYVDNDKADYQMMNYGELLYLIMREIPKTWNNKNSLNRSKKCACSTSSYPLKSYSPFIMCVLMFNFQMN